MKTRTMKLFLIAALAVFFASCAVPTKKPASKPVPAPELRKASVPAGSAPGSILISFRIDRVIFTKEQREALENAQFIARKYNITFDLSVVAQKFETYMDPEVFRIYESNQDIFEIAAFGLTAINPVNPNSRGEFYNLQLKESVPYDAQENNIKKMMEIFEKRSIYTATQIFIVPYNAGDENTIKIALKYGYKLIAQNPVPDGTLIQNYENSIIVQNSYAVVPGKANISDKEIDAIDKKIQQLIDKNSTRIQVVFNTNNFITQEAGLSADRVISAITTTYKNTAIKFGKISAGVVAR
jgi:hypothetical protein